MTETNQENSINARSGNVSSAEQALSKLMPKIEAVQEKDKGGRPPKAQYQQPIMEVLALSASEAAERIRQYVKRAKGAKHYSRDYLSALYFVIDHTIGKARQKVELSGGVLAYGELAKSADKLDKKPRPVLSEALDIAHKYQAEHPPAGSETGDDPGGSTPEKPGDVAGNDGKTG